VVNGKEDMRGAKTFERGTFGFWGRENYLDIRRLYWSIFQGRDWKTVFLVFGLRNLVDCYRGASVAGSFGLRGQESLRNPGARESGEALFLAGWEVRWFWAVHQAKLGTTVASVRGMYFHYSIVLCNLL
jgi:hypothetical protein